MATQADTKTTGDSKRSSVLGNHVSHDEATGDVNSEAGPPTKIIDLPGDTARVLDHEAERKLCFKFDIRILPILAVMCKLPNLDSFDCI